eukprot:764809-Rhodomonas_salina.1
MPRLRSERWLTLRRGSQAFSGGGSCRRLPSLQDIAAHGCPSLRGFCESHLTFGGDCACENVKWGKKFSLVDPIEGK